MPRLLILSDSHRADEYIRRAAELFCKESFDAVFHLGDFVRDAKYFGVLANKPPFAVAGNCDGLLNPEAPRKMVQSIGGFRLLACHGDQYGVKTSLARLSYRAEELNCSVALFGHTHKGYAGYVGSTLLINPGALMNGRYAVLEIEGPRVVPRLLRL